MSSLIRESCSILSLTLSKCVKLTAPSTKYTRSFSYTTKGAAPPLTSTNLNQSEITALFKKQLSAIIIKNFIPTEICDHVAKKLLSGRIKDYTNAPGIGRIGIAYYETTEDPTLKDEYFNTALKNIDLIRSVFFPSVCPIDLVRLKCDEVWPYGAHLARENKKAKFVGLCRSLEAGKDILPHEDKLERDDLSRDHKPLFGQIAINLYLQSCEKGGRLQLWNLSLPDPIYNSMRKESYGITRDKLTTPDFVIKPEAGDLILFNPTNLHAVEKVYKTRLSISAFMGCETESSPLIFWS